MAWGTPKRPRTRITLLSTSPMPEVCMSLMDLNRGLWNMGLWARVVKDGSLRLGEHFVSNIWQQTTKFTFLVLAQTNREVINSRIATYPAESVRAYNAWMYPPLFTSFFSLFLIDTFQSASFTRRSFTFSSETVGRASSEWCILFWVASAR